MNSTNLTYLLIALIVIIIIVILIVVIRRNNSKKQVVEIMKKFPVSQSKPTFLRENNRIEVRAPILNVSTTTLPKEFDSRSRWKQFIGPTTNQGDCGACWSYSTTSVFSDRIRIKSEGKDLNSDDFISPYHLAACMKCDHKTGVCSRVCEGHYLDEVLKYLVERGCYAHKDINNHTKNGTEYICYLPENTSDSKIFKGKSYYRVNPYSMDELKDKERREVNTKTIMNEIFTNGPVTAVIKVFNPTSTSELHKNFYLYRHGVYGNKWTKEPSLFDGYHAINIIGWGVDKIDNEEVPFWYIRNSWGEDWGMNGFGKVFRGKNIAVIESDVWTLSY